MTAEVYLARLADGAPAERQAEALERVLRATGFIGRLGKKDLVAIKLHVGERNNVTHLRPELAAAAVKMLKAVEAEPFLTDTSTLYKSQRDNAIKHILHAHRHGFGIEAVGAPFFPLDGLVGRHELEVEIQGELHPSVKVAGEVFLADALLCLAHATGHMGTGMGAAIKTVGMGLSSRAGKMRQHSSIKPEVIVEFCQNCGKCRKWCPADAITEKDGVSFIDLEQCIGCGECLAVCRFSAVKFDWRKGATLQQSMAEHAAAVLRHFGPKAVFANVLVDMTKDCDCMDKTQEKIMPDLGLLASNDIVAADQATLDLTQQAAGKSLSELSFPGLNPTLQMAHAEKLGLGSRQYRLVEV
jgi:hypothetical protein